MEQKIIPEIFYSRMFPTVSLREKDTLDKLLGVFESHEKFLPNKWGNKERIRLDYDKSEIINLADLDKIYQIYLDRKLSIKYSGHFDLDLSSSSFLSFAIDKSMPSKHWSAFFELFDQVAKITKPRYGVTQIRWPSPEIWTNDNERFKIWMFYASSPAPVNVGPNGPIGLGMRTYFGGNILEMFGREIFKDIPAIVTEMEWGGIRVDLVDKPWAADPELIFERWLAAMKHLEAAQVFAIPIYKKDCTWVKFSPNTVWERYIQQLRDKLT